MTGRLRSAEARSRLAARVRPLLYRGDDVHCGCCGRHFRSFADHGHIRAVRCPRCGSLPRHRLLARWFGQHPRLLDEAGELLHFAPERCLRGLFAGRERLHYVSADLDSPLAEHHFDIQDIPFDDDRFDAILCSHVLEYVPDERRALGELRRVLRPGGWALFLVPLLGRAHTEELGPGESPHHDVRRYGLDFEQRLRDAGLEVELERPAERLSDQHVRHHGLNPDDVLFLCHEPRGAVTA
jgi:SAM-dependent methyltransferase